MTDTLTARDLNLTVGQVVTAEDILRMLCAPDVPVLGRRPTHAGHRDLGFHCAQCAWEAMKT